MSEAQIEQEEQGTVNSEQPQDDKYQELLDKLSLDEYKNRAYLNDINVPVNARLWSNMIIHIRNMQVTINSFAEAFDKVAKKIDEDSTQISLLMMEQHIKHIEAGLTISEGEANKIQAEDDITEEPSRG